MRRKKGKEREAPATGDPRVTPEEVQQVEFRLAFRGYSERDVDAFLDRVTEDLSSYLEENRQLRSGSASPQSPDPELASDSIIARAREEAAAIVSAAEEQAAAIRSAAAASAGVPGGARNAVAPFLNKERDFLQGLGTLVQGHAEDIKQMVMAIREGSERPAPTEADAGDGEVPATFEPASAEEIRERLGDDAASDEGVSVPADDLSEEPPKVETIVVESATEPVYSSEGAQASERRERSLRELFWGEE